MGSCIYFSTYGTCHVRNKQFAVDARMPVNGVIYGFLDTTTLAGLIKKIDRKKKVFSVSCPESLEKLKLHLEVV